MTAIELSKNEIRALTQKGDFSEVSRMLLAEGKQMTPQGVEYWIKRGNNAKHEADMIRAFTQIIGKRESERNKSLATVRAMREKLVSEILAATI